LTFSGHLLLHLELHLGAVSAAAAEGYRIAPMDERAVTRQVSVESGGHERTTLGVRTENTRPTTTQPWHGQQRDWPSFLLIVFLIGVLLFFGCLTVVTIATRPSAGNYVSQPVERVDQGLEPGEQQPHVACRPCRHGETINCCQSDTSVPSSIQKVGLRLLWSILTFIKQLN